jgi:hypothetical protein
MFQTSLFSTIMAMEMTFQENLTTNHLMRMVLMNNMMIMTTLTMMYNTVSQMQSPHWPEMCNIKKMDPA